MCSGILLRQPKPNCGLAVVESGELAVLALRVVNVGPTTHPDVIWRRMPLVRNWKRNGRRIPGPKVVASDETGEQ
jgi:hypothetical protein